jgi:soluble lytic murein transglycosylase-like protein
VLGSLAAVSSLAAGQSAAPEAGDLTADAAHLLQQAKRHEHGVGAVQDIDRALRLYCEASGLGSTEARYHLGWLYASGRVGAVDEVLAAAWYRAARDAEHPRARQQLASLGALEIELAQRPQCVLSAAVRERRIADLAPSQRTAADEPEMPEGITVRAVARRDIVALVQRLAPEYRLDPELVLAVIEVESDYDPQARSPKNAQGLMQLIPATAARFGVTNVWDPVENLRGGMAYLRTLLDYFGGDLELALAAYNAGEQAVEEHGGIPPYPETRAYVKRVKRRLQS